MVFRNLEKHGWFVRVSPREGNGNPLQFQGQRSLVGYSPRGCKESDTTERLFTSSNKTQIRRKLKLKIEGFKDRLLMMESSRITKSWQN